MNKKAAFLFPGQGSQVVGMGHDLYQEFDYVREIFDMTDEVTKRHISKLCFNGPMEDLTLTVNLQPAVTAVNLACLAVLKKEGQRPSLTAGHSLGEYSALACSEAIGPEATMRLVHKRGELMHREASRHEGAMHAILGLDIDAVTRIVAEAAKDGVVAVANHNAEKQIVITGEPDAVEQASKTAAEQGAKAIPLKVSGAWHSELIRGAEEDFRSALNEVTFSTPDTPLIFNVTADFESDPEKIKEIMASQLCNPVKWYDSVCKMCDEGIEVFAEVGPKKVLTGLLRKIIPDTYDHEVYNVDGLQGVEKFLKAVS